MRLTQRLGVEFAFPTQTLHVASMPPGLSAAKPAAPTKEGVEPPALDTKSHDEAIVIGRKEAEAIVKGLWGSEEPQPPVRFDDPERLPPGN